MAGNPRQRCPLYCTVDHKSGVTGHSRLIAEIQAGGENVDVTVKVGRLNAMDWVRLGTIRGWNEPVVAHLTAHEARTLRDALSVAVALLDRA